jgi:hypothetical protein
VPRIGRRAAWAAIVLLVAAFALAPVILSHDVYSYVDYGRLGAIHGLDPYTHPPRAAPADPLYAEVRWRGTPSVYGPLFTLLSYPLALLPPWAAVASLKALAGGATLAVAALVERMSAPRGIDPLRAACFVALNPLVLVHVVGGAHNDALAMALAMAGTGAVLALREASGGALLLSAFAVKPTAALAAPFAFLGGRDRRRFLLGVALAGVAIGIGAWSVFGWSWLDALGLAGESQGRAGHMSVPVTLARLTGLDAGAVRVVALSIYGALAAWLLVATARGGDWLRAAGWAAAGLLLATAWLLPWYLVWALPYAALSRDRRLQMLVLALTAFQLGARIPL